MTEGAKATSNGSATGADGSTHDIWVGDLAPNVEDYDMSVAFSKCGEIKAVRIMRREGISRGFGFVNFATEEAQKKAVRECSGMLIKGKPISIRIAFKRGIEGAAGPSRAGGVSQGTYPVFVGSIPTGTDDGQLSAAFAKFGPIKSTRIKWDGEGPTGFGFVNFESTDGQQAAIDAKGVEVNGAMCEVLRSRSRQEGGGGRGGRGGFRGGRGRGGFRGGRGGWGPDRGPPRGYNDRYDDHHRGPPRGPPRGGGPGGYGPPRGPGGYDRGPPPRRYEDEPYDDFRGPPPRGPPRGGPPPRDSYRDGPSGGGHSGGPGGGGPPAQRFNPVRPEDRTCLYMGNVPKEMPKVELLQELERIGGPISELLPKAGFCFINYNTFEDAERALAKFKGAIIGGRAINCQFSKTEGEKPDGNREERARRTCYVQNLTRDVTEEEMFNKFSIYGNTRKVTVVKDQNTGQSKGFAFIEYEHESNANEAVRVLDQTPFKGQAISVQISRVTSHPNDRHRSGPSGGGGGARGPPPRGADPYAPPPTRDHYDAPPPSHHHAADPYGPPPGHGGHGGHYRGGGGGGIPPPSPVSGGSHGAPVPTVSVAADGRAYYKPEREAPVLTPATLPEDKRLAYDEVTGQYVVIAYDAPGAGGSSPPSYGPGPGQAHSQGGPHGGHGHGHGRGAHEYAPPADQHQGGYGPAPPSSNAARAYDYPPPGAEGAHGHGHGHGPPPRDYAPRGAGAARYRPY